KQDMGRSSDTPVAESRWHHHDPVLDPVPLGACGGGMSRTFFSFAIVLISLAVPTPSTGAATIRVAVLDALQSQKFASAKYEEDYFHGLQVAIDELAQAGLNVEVKRFIADKPPTAVLSHAKAIRTWRPDAIIGPRSSNRFLLLRNEFTDTLVLSPMATADA